ncbi:MAG: cytochrome c oxidase subunit 3 [Hydrogenophilaceae bacterium]|jgi:cytochrome c oxidase subunit 3|nr:cytochrome c oxidase subunit 3 [Hydrogenophilaceae bacterium]
MAAHAEVKHDYHLVDPSPWPFVASCFVFLMAVGGVVAMRGVLPASEDPGFWGHIVNTVLVKGKLPLFIIGAAGVVMSAAGWWLDVIKESRKGDHTPVVDIGLRYGMILFIASEVMFFAAWFWVFFELSIFHDVRANWVVPLWEGTDTAARWANWPPPNVETFDPFHLPLMNTLILLLSGTTVTWAHHALQQGDRRSAMWGLLITVLLGCAFTYVQFVLEYPHAGFKFGNNDEISTANLYGASFFMATGFHGVHVIIGTIFLAVCLIRLMAGQFTPKKHFGLEAAAWYWHFVDVVWLFLFTFVYVLPYLTMQE